MSSTLSRISRAKSEIRRRESLTWSEAAIDVRCRIFLSEIDWPWAGLELGNSWTPVEEVHAMSEYPLSNDVLCSVCLQFDVADGVHQPDGASLVQSASGGCRLCSIILDSFTANYPDNLNILLEHNDSIILNLRVEDKTRVTAGYRDRIVHKGVSRFFNASHQLGLLSAGDTTMFRGKANAIEFIGEKVKRCLFDHERCPNTLEQPLPLRLIDVGRSGGDEADQPRLWINEQTHAANDTMSPCGVYAALSYCWGVVPFLTLTPETSQDLQRRIPMEKLPLTLQDAIEITRGLGIRYLWIDALCIFQGQSMEAKKDWSQQSAQMDTIYSQAAIVLGVAAPSNAYDGISCWPYHYRDIVEIRPLRETMPTDDDDGFRRCFLAVPETPPEDDLGPLHTRGWTFQERILATRFVHLGREKVFFECDHGREYEFHADDHFQHQLCKRLDSRPGFESWHTLVEEYSRRYLTVPTDRLIALSGVAKQFAAKTDEPGRYLAGLWEGNLARDLLWCVASAGAKTDVAPSWSRAARRSEISYQRLRHHACTPRCATVVGTHVTNFPALYGFRCAGSVTLKGYLRKIFLREEQDRYHVIGFQAPRTPAEHRDTRHGMGMCLIDFPNAASSLDRVADRFPQAEARSWEDVFEAWCLELHPGRGVLLTPAGGDQGEFERIGYFEYQERRLRGDTMLPEERASNRNPLAQAAFLVDHPFNWMRTALEAGQEELIQDWFGDPDAIVTII